MNDTQDADIVIVGAGVAGSMVAHQLAMAGKSVLILEAGPRVPRWQTVERFRNQPDKGDMSEAYPNPPWAPAPHYSKPHDYYIQKGAIVYASEYLRMVGGTTWHFTANTWRFRPNDFKEKSTFGVGRDWPISYDDLEPYYYKAEVEIGVTGDQDYGSPRKQPYPMRQPPTPYAEKVAMELLNAFNPEFNVTTQPACRASRPYDGRPTCSGNNNCSPICPIGAMYNGIMHVEKAEHAGARVLENAVAYKIEVGPDRKIKAVHYKDSQGASHRIIGKYFVLASHTIETPKLMLISTSGDYPNGVGNSSGMVGRNLMDHPKTSVTFYSGKPLWPGRGPEQSTSMIGYCDGAFRSTMAAKKIQNWDLNVTLSETQKIFKEGKLLKPAALNARIRDRASRFMSYNSYHEILPLPTNRVVPSKTEKDAIGIPRPEIYWNVDDYVKRGAAHTRKVFADIVSVLGGSETEYDDTFGTSQHPVGTTIMGNDPRDSVVDADCRSFDHQNLFIASGAVMASVSTFNITLTIAALALRVADTLKKEV